MEKWLRKQAKKQKVREERDHTGKIPKPSQISFYPIRSNIDVTSQEKHAPDFQARPFDSKGPEEEKGKDLDLKISEDKQDLFETA